MYKCMCTLQKSPEGKFSSFLDLLAGNRVATSCSTGGQASATAARAAPKSKGWSTKWNPQDPNTIFTTPIFSGQVVHPLTVTGSRLKWSSGTQVALPQRKVVAWPAWHSFIPAAPPISVTSRLPWPTMSLKWLPTLSPWTERWGSWMRLTDHGVRGEQGW